MSSATEDIIAAIEFAARQDLVRFVRQDGKVRLSLWREPAGTAVTPPPRTTENAEENAAQSAAPTAAAGVVTSPIAGLCHLSPEPGSPAFVSEGARVEKGQTICLIEAMKVMTAVSVGQSGTVSRVMMRDGALVRADDPLIEVQS